jgi:superkiller protein 3
VIDFGVAKATGPKLTDRTLYTEFGSVVGTLEYMSPEQAELNQLDIDTRSDVYSLGVLLYELLTGTTPLQRGRLKQAAILEALRLVREEEPPRPSTRLSTTLDLPSIAACRGTEPRKLSRQVHGELDWIVMRALEKDRDRRYETANGLARDLQRYLADEVVEARPPSTRYRLRKFVRRHRAALAVAGLILFFVAVLGGGGGWVVRDRAARAEEAARERRDREQRLTAQVELILADVDRLEREQKWPEAHAAMDRAEAALAGGEAGAAVRGRVADARPDLAFVAELDRIRQQLAITVQGKFDKAGAAREYAAAFRGYGADVEALPAEKVLARLRGNPALAAPVAAALDDWRYALKDLGEGEARWGPLLTCARALDPDPLRNRLRAMATERFTPALRDELRRLAESIDVKAQGPATLFSLARALTKAGLPDSAVHVLRDGQYAFPTDFWLSFQLVNAFARRKDCADAIRYASVAVSVRSGSAAAHGNLGAALAEQGKLDEAIAECRQAIALDPKLAESHNGLGSALRGQGKLDEAIAEYRKVIALDPKNALAHNTLGFALHNQGKLDEAIAEYRQAVALDPKDANAHNNLGAALHNQGKLDEAIAEYRQAIALDPKVAQAHRNLGNVLRDQGKLDEAIAECRQAIALDPKYANAHNTLGVALRGQGKLDEAIAEFRQAMALDPKDARTHNNLGDALAGQEKLDEAIAEFRQAIALDPKVAISHDNLGIALAGQGKLDEAIAEYRQAVALDPKDANAHNNLGAALGDQGKLDEATAEYRQAIALDPKVARAHRNLGNVLRDQGKLDEAIAECRQAIALDPTYANAHNTLGIALAGQGKLDEAIAEFRQAMALDPKDANAHNNLGVALRLQRKRDEAIAEFRQAIRLKPDYLAPYGALATLLATAADPKLRDDAEALRLARKMVELAPADASSWQALGWTLYRTGAWKDSIEAFHKSMDLQQEPKGGDAGQWFGLAADHGRLGNNEEARKWYGKAVQWMEKNTPRNKEDLTNEEFRRFRTEAEQVLGVKGKG